MSPHASPRNTPGHSRKNTAVNINQQEDIAKVSHQLNKIQMEQQQRGHRRVQSYSSSSSTDDSEDSFVEIEAIKPGNL